jgi:hypothetical protein
MREPPLPTPYNISTNVCSGAAFPRCPTAGTSAPNHAIENCGRSNTHLAVTTKAFDEAASRVSRQILMQTS